MLFGERLLYTRKKKKISQEDLAKQIGVHAPIIGRYERDEVKPSIEMAYKIAETLEVSLDYLTGLTDVQLDKSLTDIISSLQQLKEDDRKDIINTLNALVRDAKARSAYSS
ncbi:helix-turn-helix domain-containing protein [Flavobacterium covae]|uniref:helix-turn-helix domain-containing protein n=1 Tax=Flavobacterium covae TaxID=2906076 RepID=UPI0033995AEA